MEEFDLIRAEDLSVQFNTTYGSHAALRKVGFSMKKGESLGIVGESGCGKSVTALSIMKLIPDPPGKITGGSIKFLGRDLTRENEKGMQKIRGNEVSMIFQEPMTSLNPIHTCGKQIMEPLVIHKNFGGREAREAAIEHMRMVGIPSPEQRFREYPHQMSGGMRQRVMIAMAMACSPKLLIADEPTTALDVTIQAQILDLMQNLREKSGAGIIMITHDLGIIYDICDKVAVMYAGQIVETGSCREIFKDPLHPYTRGLLLSIPRIHGEIDKLYSIPGTVPSPYDMPPGCAFAPRCERALEQCFITPPELLALSGERASRCWHFADTESKRGA